MSAVAPRPGIAESRVVEASAGTGKTRKLVGEIVWAIRSGVEVDRIVAVTFTHAAAGEMKLRVRQELDRARAEATGEECARLSRALQTLDRAFIGTIHSFCAQLLRRRPVEAGVDPSFQELSQPEAQRVFAGAFRTWIERKLAAPSPALTRALARLAWMEDSGGQPLDVLRAAAWRLAEWRDHPAPWERRNFTGEEQLEAILARARSIATMASGASNRFARDLQPVAEFVATVDRAQAAAVVDPATLESETIQLARCLRWLRNGAPDLMAECEKLAAEIDEYRNAADADLASALRDELWEVVLLYNEAKRNAGQLDFLDLLICARDLIRNDTARPDLQSRYDRIYVDEFQDTDPLQAEILLLLAADGPRESNWLAARPSAGKLFVVGDPKQSIYRFRRADAALYRSIHGHLLAAGAREERMSVSHRSVDTIQQFANAAFENSIRDYLPLEGGDPAPEAQPSVIALPMPRPYGTKNISKAAIDACAPAAVAALIDWLIHDSGWTIRDPESKQRVPVRDEHVCILFRRFTNNDVDLTQEYVRELEARGVKHVLVGSKSFHQREEVGTLRTALRAIEWPEDELSVFAVLRGALFAIPDGTLLKFHHAYNRFSAYVSLPEDLDEEFAPVRDAFQILFELHRRRNHVPLAGTIQELIQRTRGHVSFAFRKGGERVLANVFRLTDIARNFEAGGATSFRAFVEFLEHESAAGETQEAPVLEQDVGGVKLMTVHRAKGLEFPVVILADLTAHLTGGEGGDRWVNTERGLCAQRLCRWAPWELLDHAEEEAAADRDEALRLAYVAATRARDLLVVSAVGEKEMENSWLAPLWDALYPRRLEWRHARAHSGCPVRGTTTVLNRPPECPDEVSVRPGLHRPKSGSHDVVWFDPALLQLDSAKDEGVDREELLAGTPEQKKAGLDQYHVWLQRRAQTIAAAANPSCRVSRIGDLPAIPWADAIPVDVVSSGVPQRPAGRRFGRLVHAALQFVRSADGAERVVEAQSRRLRCTIEESVAAVAAVRAALAHPLIASCAGMKQHREFPVALRLDDGTIVEGNIDLAWTDGASWVVVDYKTGSADQSRYRRQLQLYGLALARATNQPVRCLLFEV